MIIAGGTVGNFMTSDSTAKQIPSDLARFLHLSLKNEINNLSDEAKNELGFDSEKDKLIKKLKQDVAFKGVPLSELENIADRILKTDTIK